jgi:hypothetical protein
VIYFADDSRSLGTWQEVSSDHGRWSGLGCARWEVPALRCFQGDFLTGSEGLLIKAWLHRSNVAKGETLERLLDTNPGEVVLQTKSSQQLDTFMVL